MANQGQVYEFGPFSLDAEERVLRREGQPVPLRPKDVDMLLVLVENNGRVVEKDELMKRVWPDTFVEEANLSHHVFTLRKALGDGIEENRFIETVPRRGYRFAAAVAGPSEPASPPAPPAAARDASPAVGDDIHPHPRARVGRWQKVMTAAAVVALAAAAAYGGWLLKPAPSRSITRLPVMLSQDDMFTDGPSSVLALSPDGTRLVYAANGRLYLRPLDRLEAAPIPGIQRPGLASARAPFFSPDGQWIGFWEQRQLKKVSIHGAAPIPLCDLGPPPYGASWAADDTILIGHGSRGIWRVHAGGGTCEAIVTVEDGQRVYGPQMLPDGESVLFSLARSPNWDDAEVVVQSIKAGTRRSIVRGTAPRYLSTGHLVYVQQDTMLGVRFDPTSLSIAGAPVRLVERVRRPGGAFGSAAEFAVSSDGTLAYIEPKHVDRARRTLVWVDRQGREEALPVEPRAYVYPRMSPDGSRLALDIQDENRDIWVWDFSRRTLTRVTTHPARDVEPLWTPDGRRLVFLSVRTGMGNLFWQSADGSGTAEQLTDVSQIRGADAMTPDGKSLVLRESDGKGTFDLTLLKLPDGAAARPMSSVTKPLVQSAFEESNAAISPDGRWLAYQSNNSGSAEVYLRPFPDAGARQWQVSGGGGTEPLWSGDGRELFYRSLTGAVIRVSVTSRAQTPLGAPVRVFESSSYALGGRDEFATLLRRTYDVSPDGRRFLMLKRADVSATPAPPERIVIVQNWFDEVNAKLRRN